MTVLGLLEELSERACDLTLEEGKLRVSAPRGVLTPELMQRIRGEREAIVAALASAFDDGRDSGPIPACPLADPAPLTQAQYQLWFLSKLDGNTAMLNVPLTLRLRGPLSVAALAAAVRDIGRRHDALRSKIVTLDDAPYQVRADVELELKFEDYSHLGASEADRIVFARRAEELSRPIELESAPLARFFLYKSSAVDHVLVVVASHLVCDGHSQDILLRELESLYDHHLRGSAAPVGPAVRFADFASWQRRTLEGRKSSDLDYWRQRLAGMPSSFVTGF